MTDELKEAIHTVSKYGANEVTFKYVVRLAEAYLAQLDREAKQAAEDDGPVTKSVLEEFGFGFSFGEWEKVIDVGSGFRHVIRYTTHTAESRWEFGGGTEYMMMFAPLQTPTIRQLRNLISALEGSK